ncbi:carbon-nitrogen family hydrolase [Cytobacillus kochii]
MKLHIACIQMDIQFGHPEENYKHVEIKVKEACEVQPYPDIIVLPEMWTTGYDLDNLSSTADVKGEKTIAFLKNLAKQYQVHIVGGSVATKRDEEYFNTMISIDKNGELLQEYHKMHLFKLMDEHKFLSAGEEKGSFVINGEKVAGMICYDIRFPEWFRAHTLNGTKAIFVVAEWPKPRVDHWQTLLRARAIENQCYVIACNRVGQDPNNRFAGHSMIIDPWGEVLKSGTEEEEIVTATIDLSEVDRVRKTIPVFDDRKPEFYT